MKTKLRLFCASFLAFITIARADLLITEFLASNNQGLTDEDGIASDWIEIHNTGPGSVNLSGWHLTDDPAILNKWAFPIIFIGSGNYRVVFASGKNRSAIGSELHTNFKLSKDGEYLALVEPDGTTIAFEYAPGFPVQTPDTSYGVRLPGLTKMYFTTPTPLAENGLGFDGIVANVAADQDRGLYDSPFALAFSTDTPAATIRYTTDATEPTATHGTVYSAPFTVNTTTIFRVVAFKENFLPSEVVTYSFIFPADVVNQPANPPGFPSSWKGTSASYEMNPDYPESDETIIAALRSLPSLWPAGISGKYRGSGTEFIGECGTQAGTQVRFQVEVRTVKTGIPALRRCHGRRENGRPALRLAQLAFRQDRKLHGEWLQTGAGHSFSRPDGARRRIGGPGLRNPQHFCPPLHERPLLGRLQPDRSA
jgi:hypothetical protein